MKHDSIDKIVTVYLAAITEEQFIYDAQLFTPKPLKVSPMLLRATYCPENCGGCCPKFTLDYIPVEQTPKGVQERSVRFNGKQIKILSILQNENKDHFCKFLDKSNGRCTIHEVNPFSCVFEPLRFRMGITVNDFNVLGCYPFGRGWSFKTTDGGRGAKCRFINHVSVNVRNQVIQKLERLQQWAEYFGLKKTKVPAIIAAINRFEIKDKLLTF